MGQSLRPETNVAPKVNKPDAEPTNVVQQKPEPVVLSQPTGKLRTTTLSLNEAIEEQRRKQFIPAGDLPHKDFDINDVIQHWKAQGHLIKAGGNDLVGAAMLKRDIHQLDETHFQFVCDVPIVTQRLTNLLPEIVSKIREKIENYSLQITVVLNEVEEEEDAQFMNGNQRFEKMRKKNPNLELLKIRFNLNIDY